MVKQVPERLLDDVAVNEIDIGRVGGNDADAHEQRARARGRAFRHDALSDGRANKGMRDIVHVCMMLPQIAPPLTAGRPALAHRDDDKREVVVLLGAANPGCHRGRKVRRHVYGGRAAHAPQQIFEPLLAELVP